MVSAEDPFAYEKPGPRKPRLIDYESLSKYVAKFPDQTFAERATVFGVSTEGIPYALGKRDITQKKSLRYKKQCPEKGVTYEATLAKAIQAEKRSPVYVDECGFTAETLRTYGYAPHERVDEPNGGFRSFVCASLFT